MIPKSSILRLSLLKRWNNSDVDKTERDEKWGQYKWKCGE